MPLKSCSDLSRLPAERITHAPSSSLQCPGRESHFNCVRELRLRDVQWLAPGLEAKKRVKGVTDPGRLVLKPVVQDSARSPEQPLPRAQKAARSGWRTSCFEFPKSPRERNVKGVGGPTWPSGHVRPPPHVQGTHGETGMFLPSSSPAFWGRPTDINMHCHRAEVGTLGAAPSPGLWEAAQRSPSSKLSFEGAEQ